MAYGFVEILQLIGALGVFLFGMKQMSDALTDLAGDRMRSILATMTSNRFRGVLTGFLITSVIQSSSATTLMVVSFANASLLSLAEAISVIMGANIGTTTTAWMITLLGFKVSMNAIALPLVGLGVILTFLKRKSWKQWGNFIIGFGLLFVGLEFLKEHLPDIQQNPQILEFLQEYTRHGFASVLLFLLVGTLLTVLIQSSSATMALTLLMTAKGWIPFEAAAAMVLGENIGTTITANLAAIVGNFRAKQAALAHLFFNLLGVVWMLLVFYPFLRGVSWVTGQLGSGSPFTDALAVPVAISLFHSFFNLANTLIMVWFVRPMSRLVGWMVPERALPERPMEEPKFLNNEALAYPETAIAALEQESRYLYEHAIFEIVSHALSLHRTDILSETKPKKVVKKSRKDLQVDVRELYLTRVKRIYSEIIAFAVNAQSDLNLSENQHRRVSELKLANRKMVEIIKDAREVKRNVSRYLKEGHKIMIGEYDEFRKKMVKVLRVIREFQEGDREVHVGKLAKLSREASDNIHAGNLQIDSLIREGMITPEMASSLVNDHDNLNDMIENLILVAEILYQPEN
ncbi:MAG: Na/Pi cotransporter family protein [Flavobacteriaceae bacterium]|jgi:phosphate:Na+ symporter|nr:MAG: Na/Pi cotransporter family protein [Flavobacteriaceae bacterium]